MDATVAPRLAVLAVSLLAGCSDAQTSDLAGNVCKTDGLDSSTSVGACCRNIPGGTAPLPVGVDDDGVPTLSALTHPAYDCDSLTCAAFGTASAFCTIVCMRTADCPEGLDCLPSGGGGVCGSMQHECSLCD